MKTAALHSVRWRLGCPTGKWRGRREHSDANEIPTERVSNLRMVVNKESVWVKVETNWCLVTGASTQFDKVSILYSLLA